MEIVFRILQEYDGIIGEVLGVIATLITTDWLSQKGKLNLYIMTCENEYNTYGDVGCYKGGKEKTDFYGYENQVKLEIYNGSNNPKIMRNIKIRYYKNNIEKYVVIPKDESSARISEARCIIKDEIEVINFRPKEVMELKISNYIHEKDLEKIEMCNRIYLTYNDEKNRKRKILLSKKIITKDNYRKKGD